MIYSLLLHYYYISHNIILKEKNTANKGTLKI